MDWNMMRAIGSVVGVSFAVLTSVVNLIVLIKITANHLKHLSADVKDIKGDTKQIKETQIKQGERIAKIEGRLNGNK